jgi:hypothetical protein
MKKSLKYSGIALLVTAVGIQFVRPEMANPPEAPANTLEATLAVPANVQEILGRSCMDCHSHRTRWPWYSNVAPASWLVASDVEDARQNLNFSEWGTYKTKRKIARLEMIASEVDEDGMPPSQYLLLHRDAHLTETDKVVLVQWAERVSDSLKSISE